MRRAIHLLIFFLWAGRLPAQISGPEHPTQEEQLELLTEKQDREPEDDSYWQDLESLRKHPLNLNRATEEDLMSTGLLTGLQVSTFFGYRTLLGDLISIYELQAVPAWDLETIRKLLPYVKLGESSLPLDNFDNRWRRGESGILIRASEVLEKSKGYSEPTDSAASHYLGSAQHLTFRYDYRYRQLLQFGWIGDKDAGEQFFRGAQKFGFDFYSFHLFSRQSGLIRTLTLGDFTVNLGQGLIQWQSLAFSKGGQVLSIKRQAPTIRPYNSPGEFNFHRGIGLTLARKKWSATLFLSVKKISANLKSDTLSRDDEFSSLESSGYHRTKREIEDKNNVGQTAEGLNIQYSAQAFHVGLNAIHFTFSKPFQKQDRPYNLFSIKGRSWTNSSIDYSYTYRNLHWFGEAAVDQNGHLAFVNGALVSLGAHADAAMLHRYINKEYQALYADAFTENSSPTNENGFYMGLSLRPTDGLQAELYMDIYKFPWLKYRIDGAGRGHEYFIQLIYKPNKDWTFYSRYKSERKSGNLDAGTNSMHEVQSVPRQDWRTDFQYNMSKVMKIRSRIELLWYAHGSSYQEEGFLGLIDLHYQSVTSPIGGNLRVQWVETSGYASRIYAFENDLLYSYSLPAFYDKTLSYYINLHFRIDKLFIKTNKKTRELGLWLRWGQSYYPDKKAIGSGLDEIKGNLKSTFKFQLVSGW